MAKTAVAPTKQATDAARTLNLKRLDRITLPRVLNMVNVALPARDVNADSEAIKWADHRWARPISLAYVSPSVRTSVRNS